ncbi:MAG: DJ-1/PfpI family protein [Bacteroidales bacterium]|nr:DJ-1/PfpI family protein [Bacteroidales bacterium]
MKRSLLFLADGFEEIEALTVVDVMRRAGMDVKTVSIKDSHKVIGAHGITVEADMLIAEADMENVEWMITPGGMPGSTHLSNCETLSRALRKHHSAGGKIAAICAAPAVVLYPLGILDGKEATCYPGFESECKNAVMRDASIITSEELITANGPATALRFALAIVANSMGEGIAQEVGSGMLHYPRTMNFYF